MKPCGRCYPGDTEPVRYTLGGGGGKHVYVGGGNCREIRVGMCLIYGVVGSKLGFGGVHRGKGFTLSCTPWWCFFIMSHA